MAKTSGKEAASLIEIPSGTGTACSSGQDHRQGRVALRTSSLQAGNEHQSGHYCGVCERCDPRQTAPVRAGPAGNHQLQSVHQGTRTLRACT